MPSTTERPSSRLSKPVLLKVLVDPHLRWQLETLVRDGDRNLSAEIRKALRAHIVHDLSTKVNDLCSVIGNYDGSFGGDLGSFVSDLAASLLNRFHPRRPLHKS